MARPIKFYTDGLVAKAVIRGLRLRGVDVLTAPEAGLLGAADVHHLNLAHSEGRVLFSQDDDFIRLHAAGVQHSRIAYAKQSLPIGKIVSGLMLIFHVLDSADMIGHLEYL